MVKITAIAKQNIRNRYLSNVLKISLLFYRSYFWKSNFVTKLAPLVELLSEIS